MSAMTIRNVEDKELENGFVYRVRGENDVMITGYVGSETEVIVPSEIEGREVKRISSNAFSNCRNIRKITIPDTVTSIGEYAFNMCFSLEEIELPDELEGEIGAYTFCFCSSLKEIVIPNGITEIDWLAFDYCVALEKIVIPDTVKKIGLGVFEYCYNLETIEISDDIELELFQFDNKIEDTKWYSQKNDGPIYLGRNLIGYKGEMPNNYVLNIEDGTYLIADEALKKQNNLKEVIIPDSVVNIGDRAFNRCSNLSTIRLGNGIKNVGDDAFYDTLWLNNQPDGPIYINDIIYIYKGDFQENSTYTIDSNVRVINPEAFVNKNNLVKIIIPDSVEEIGQNAFNGCTDLVEVRLSNKLTSLSDSLFEGCSSLESITIPESVTTIGWNVFLDCENLENIIIPESIIEIEHQAFTNTKWLNNKPAGPVYINDILYICKDGLEESSVIYIEDGTRKINGSAFSGIDNITKIVIPSSVTEIGESAFYECSDLRDLVFPDSITRLDFSELGLYSISLCSFTIPGQLTNIVDRDLSEFENLTIYTYSEDSLIEKYAQKYNIPCKVVGDGKIRYNNNILTCKYRELEEDEYEGGINKFIGTINGFAFSRDGDSLRKLLEKFDCSGIFKGYNRENINVSVYDKNNNLLNNKDLIGTGDIISIEADIVSDSDDGIFGDKYLCTVIYYGDTNGDGIISALDALAVIKNKTGEIPFTDDAYEEAGRVLSSSGTPNAIDALAIIKHANGKKLIDQSK